MILVSFRAFQAFQTFRAWKASGRRPAEPQPGSPPQHVEDNHGCKIAASKESLSEVRKQCENEDRRALAELGGHGFGNFV
jgi:hypothetical protein